MSDLESKIDRILDEITEIKIAHREYVVKQKHLAEQFEGHIEYHDKKIEPTCIAHTTAFTRFKAVAWVLSGLNIIVIALVAVKNLVKS